MSIGLAKNTTVISVMEEVTEGTYVAPAAATDYVQPLADGFDLQKKKELIERNILTSSIGVVTPRTGTKTVSASLPVEFRASGVEGQETDFDLLLQSLLGSRRKITTNKTTKASAGTTTQAPIEDADIGAFNVGDTVIFKIAGAHHMAVITSKVSTLGAAVINFLPAAGANIPSSTVISKCVTYYPANSGHKALSLSYYLGNEILDKAFGCKVTQFSLDNFTAGQLASMKFDLEGLGYDQLNGSAPHTPSFDTGLPPLILQACVFQDGVEVQVNQFSLTIANTLGFLTSTCSENGRISSRVTKRALTGSINPYKDDTSVAQFTKFDQNQEFSLYVKAFNPSTVDGEIQMGSAIGIYLPKCLITELNTGDQDGILTDELSFSATRGSAGDTEEIYLGMI